MTENEPLDEHRRDTLAHWAEGLQQAASEPPLIWLTLARPRRDGTTFTLRQGNAPWLLAWLSNAITQQLDRESAPTLAAASAPDFAGSAYTEELNELLGPVLAHVRHAHQEFINMGFSMAGAERGALAVLETVLAAETAGEL